MSDTTFWSIFLGVRWVLNEIRWRRRPQLRLCEDEPRHLAGLVLEGDYRRKQRAEWYDSSCQSNILRIKVQPIMVFSLAVRKDQHPKGVTGDSADLASLTRGCRVDVGDFYVLPDLAVDLRQAYELVWGQRRGRMMLAARTSAVVQ